MTTASLPCYRAGDVEIDVANGCLRRGSDEQHLRHKTFQVLVHLIENRGRVVSKQELLDAVWNGTTVSEGTLSQSIVDIRKAMRDDSRDPWFLKTVAKGGYRIVAEVETTSGSRATTRAEIETVRSVEIEMIEEEGDPPPARRWQTGAIAAAAVLALSIAGLSLYLQRQAGAATAQREPIVAVMFFEKQHGGADVDWLREALADMLITDLSRSGGLKVISRQQLATLLQRRGAVAPGSLPFNVLLDVARDGHATRLVSGRFSKIGDQLRIDAQLHDVESGSLLGSESLVTTTGELLTRIDSLAEGLGETLGRPSLGSRPLQETMTSDLEAYRLYSLGIEQAQGLHNTEAIALFEQALARDPGFAMAQARIGYVYSVSWVFKDKAKLHLERAAQQAGKLNPSDRLSVAAWLAIANLDFHKAMDHYRTMIDRYPTEIDAYVGLARLLQGEDRNAEVIAVARHGLLIDPKSAALHNILGGTYSNMGRHRDAVEAQTKHVALLPNEPNAHDSLGLAHQWAGDYAAATRSYRRALELQPTFDVARIHLGNTLFQTGRYRDAIAEYGRYIENARSPAEKSRGYDCITWVYLSLGDLERAGEAARRTHELNPTSFLPRYLVHLAKGDSQAAVLAQRFEELSQFTHRGQRPPVRTSFFPRVQENLSRHQYDQAIETARQMLRHRPVIFNIDAFERTLGDAYLAAGRASDAVNEYERVLRLNPNDALSRYRLGVALEQAGRTREAHEQFARFLQLWSGADADIPELRDARRRQERG